MRAWTGRGPHLAYYRLEVEYTPSQWSELPARASDVLKATDRETTERGGHLHLFWPSEETKTASLLLEGTTAVLDAAPAIAATAGGSLRLVNEFEVELPAGEATSTETRHLIVEAAFRGEILRCTGCGRATPPHLDDCPFKQIEQPAALVVENSVLV